MWIKLPQKSLACFFTPTDSDCTCLGPDPQQLMYEEADVRGVQASAGAILSALASQH